MCSQTKSHAQDCLVIVQATNLFRGCKCWVYMYNVHSSCLALCWNFFIHTYIHTYIHTAERQTYIRTRQQHTRTELDSKDQSESARVVLAHQVAPGSTGDATGSLLVLRAWLKRIALKSICMGLYSNKSPSQIYYEKPGWLVGWDSSLKTCAFQIRSSRL